MSSIYTHQNNTDKFKDINILKFRDINILKFEDTTIKKCNSDSVDNKSKSKQITQKSTPIDVPNPSKLYNYSNDLIDPSPPNNNFNNKNLILSKYSISPNTYDNFEIEKYHNYNNKMMK